MAFCGEVRETKRRKSEKEAILSFLKKRVIKGKKGYGKKEGDEKKNRRKIARCFLREDKCSR